MRIANANAFMPPLPAGPPRQAGLPQDIVEKIMSHLSPRDITMAASVDKVWAEAARSPLLWEKFATKVTVPPAQPNIPSTVEIAKDWQNRLRKSEVLWGVTIGVGLLVGGILLVDLVGAPMRDRQEKACLSRYCTSTLAEEPLQGCVDDWLKRIRQQLPDALPEGVRKCVINYGALMGVGIFLGSTAPLWGIGVAMALMVGRAQWTSRAMARQEWRAQLRERPTLESPVAIKRFAMQSLFQWEHSLGKLKQAVQEFDSQSVSRILACRPSVHCWGDTTILEDALRAANLSAVHALIAAGCPITPRCFEVAMQRGRIAGFLVLVYRVQDKPSVDYRVWISKHAFADAVSTGATEIVLKTIDILGAHATSYINANICERGATPFFVAAQKEQRAVFASMLQHGGDLGSCSQERGISVEQMARQSQALMTVLENHVPSVIVPMMANHSPEP